MADHSNNLIDKYLQEIGEVPLLTPEEEITMARRIKSNDPEALEILTKANLRFVVMVAKQYQNQGLSLNDLINEGNIGLIKASKRFDETRGFKFISYAVWWIRQSILQALAEQSRVVRIPQNKIGTITKIGKVFGDLEQEFEREPSLEEIADQMDISVDELTNSLQLSGRHVSVDEPLNDNDDSTLMDVIQDEDQEAPDRNLLSESLKIEIKGALNTLSAREAEVVKLYFGIDSDHPLTLEEIGEKFDLTRERVRQIKEKAIQRLRHASRSGKLREYLG
jgi:RNA polymerase primary sigma factor